MENASTNRKLLLIDDDADDRKYFVKAVGEIDGTIECTTAKDGQQALEMLNDRSLSLPDYIFLDLRMPKVNGRQCLTKIKGDERLKIIPVVVYTTTREVEESEELQGMGAVRFITKPTNTEEIYYVISCALEELDQQF